jgi:hypothetical protein
MLVTIKVHAIGVNIVDMRVNLIPKSIVLRHIFT